MGNNSVLSVTEVAQVRENLDKLFDELNLDAFIYEVEPQEGQWQLTIECAIEDGWERVNFSADEEYLLRGVDDSTIHEVLVDSLREALSSCNKKRFSGNTMG